MRKLLKSLIVWALAYEDAASTYSAAELDELARQLRK